MQIIVTAHEKGSHLLFPGLELIRKFLGIKPQVDLATTDETKAQQLLRMLGTIADDYFILLEEDFYLVNQVDVELLAELLHNCRLYNSDRFSLQSRHCHSYSNWMKLLVQFGERDTYKTVAEVQVPFSLEASVWRREFLQAWLEWFIERYPIATNSQDDGQIEMKISDHIREHKIETKIYALDEIVLDYRDMMRGGQEEIKLLHDPLRMVVESGNELALYPNGEDKWELLL